MVALLAMLSLGCAASAAPPPDDLRLNEIQVLGSHNSYKRAMDPQRLAELREVNENLAQALDYAHVPLSAQLCLGVRKFELDVFYDPDGAQFARAEAPAGTSSFPVLHVQNLDDRSHCRHLLECLAELVAWSDAHPQHVPIFLSFNAKDAVIDQPGFLRPQPFGEDAWMALDAELRAALGERLMTPAEVFRSGALAWPTLAEARGRFLALLDEGGDKRRQYASRWRERAMFANLPETSDGAAMLVINDPVAEFERIRALVSAGYLVRTRADADTREARSGDVARRDAAWASGAQLVSTDYYLPAGDFGTGYQVVLPGGGAARCNPVLLSNACRVPAVGRRVQDGSASR